MKKGLIIVALLLVGAIAWWYLAKPKTTKPVDKKPPVDGAPPDDEHPVPTPNPPGCKSVPDSFTKFGSTTLPDDLVLFLKEKVNISDVTPDIQLRVLSYFWQYDISATLSHLQYFGEENFSKWWKLSKDALLPYTELIKGSKRCANTQPTFFLN